MSVRLCAPASLQHPFLSLSLLFLSWLLSPSPQIRRRMLERLLYLCDVGVPTKHRKLYCKTARRKLTGWCGVGVLQLAEGATSVRRHRNVRAMSVRRHRTIHHHRHHSPSSPRDSSKRQFGFLLVGAPHCATHGDPFGQACIAPWLQHKSKAEAPPSAAAHLRW